MGNKKHIKIEFFNLGDEITEQFKIFYYSFFTKRNTQPTQEFVDVSKKLFSNFDAQQRINLSEQYFNKFIIISQKLLENKQYALALNFWIKILGFVKEWENTNKNKTLHKGTPYYFSAVASILQNDFDTAMMSMHNALEEDKNNAPNWTKLPAYYFLTLNDRKSKQYLRQYVYWIINFIRDRLDGRGSEKGGYKNHYKAKRNGVLTYAQFREKFLDSQSLNRDVKFFFVYSIIRLWHLHRLHKNKLGDDLMAPLIFTNSLFNLILVIDNLLKAWLRPEPKNQKFGYYLLKVAINENWINSQYEEQYIEDLNYNNRRKSDFNNWCEELIGFKGKKYITKNNDREREIGKLESDFVLTCGLRNFSAHTVKSYLFLWKHYSDILQSVLNCLFKTIELL